MAPSLYCPISAANPQLLAGQLESGASSGELLLAPLLKVDLASVNRDQAESRWKDAREHDQGLPLYAGRKSGDMLEWRLRDPEVLPDGIRINWSAVGPNGEYVVGPSGPSSVAWHIADDGIAGEKTWLDWKPGTWRISVEIGASKISFPQEVGWRTEPQLVIGQIVPSFAHSWDRPTGESERELRRALVQDIADYVATLDDESTRFVLRQLEAVESVIPFPALLTVYAGFWGLGVPYGSAPQGPIGGSYRTLQGKVTEAQRYWMVQELLNNSPDHPAVPGIISAEELPALIRAKQFRILHRLQVKFTINEKGRIGWRDWRPVGGHLAEPGLTKASIKTPFGFISAPDQLAPSPPEESPFNRRLVRSEDGMKISGYASARVGFEAQNPQWRLFGTQAPWIFSEIIFELDDKGSVSTLHRTSVRAEVRDNEVVLGSTAFNELSIFELETDLGSNRNLYVRRALLPMEGNLKAFLDSAAGGWPEPPSKPSFDGSGPGELVIRKGMRLSDNY